MPPESVYKNALRQSVYKNALRRKQADTLQERIKEICAAPVADDQRFDVGDAVVIHAQCRYYPHQMEDAGWEFGTVTAVYQQDTHHEYYGVEWPNGYSNYYEAYKLVGGVLFQTNQSAAVLLKSDDNGL